MATIDYTKLKVTELKQILKDRGIPSTGLSKKQQIVDALEKWDAEQAGQADEQVELVSADAERDHLAEDAETTAAATAAAEQQSAADVGETAEGEQAQVLNDEGGGDAGAAVEVMDAVPAEPGVGEATIEESAQEPLPFEASDLPPTTATSDAPLAPALTDVPSEPSAPLESNEPISTEPSSAALATPQRQLSPAVESTSSDTRKRKRRSPTPPLSQESVNKKLKAAEEDAKRPAVELPEDMEVEEESKTDARAELGSEDVKMLPMDEEKKDEPETRDREPFSPPRPKEAEHAVLKVEEEDDDTTATTSALHPPTRALYIRNLVRPLQPQQLRSHLINVAAAAPNDSILETFHLDTIRTHAFAIFASVSAAKRARSELHGVLWPDEPTRKELWVDFLPEEKAEEFVRVEEDGAAGKRDARRWEVVYETNEDGSVSVELREASSIGPMPGMGMRQGSFSGNNTAPLPAGGLQRTGEGMPNAPLGPRGDVRRPSTHQDTRPPPPSRDTASATPLSPSKSKKPTTSASFNILDQRFSSTTTKPKLYYLPVSPTLVSARLANLKEMTSRGWDDTKPGNGSFGDGGPGEVIRRYTFEEGRVVDGGPDIGNFGREGYRAGGDAGGGFDGRGRGGRGYGGGGGPRRGRR